MQLCTYSASMRHRRDGFSGIVIILEVRGLWYKFNFFKAYNLHLSFLLNIFSTANLSPSLIVDVFSNIFIRCATSSLVAGQPVFTPGFTWESPNVFPFLSRVIQKGSPLSFPS